MQQREFKKILDKETGLTGVVRSHLSMQFTATFDDNKLKFFFYRDEKEKFIILDKESESANHRIQGNNLSLSGRGLARRKPTQPQADNSAAETEVRVAPRRCIVGPDC